MEYFYKKINDKKLPYVVFLHGWGQSKLMMMPLVNLCHEFANVVAIDLPGHGDVELEKKYEIEDYLCYLSDFFIREKINPSLIVGHSFGGKIATYYALEKQDVDLLLFAPSVTKPKFSFNTWRKIRVYKILKRLLKWRIIKKIPSKYAGSNDFKNTKGVLRDTFLNIVNAYPEKNISNINSKIYAVWGKDDKTVSYFQMKKLEKYILHGSLTIVKGDHFAYLTNRKEMSNLIKNILEEK